MAAKTAGSVGALPQAEMLAGYRVMRIIREFEERLKRANAQGVVPGFVHLYAGQEAIAAGVCAHLRDSDGVVGTHRSHGHAIAKGSDLNMLMAEIFGRATGQCGGKGGSMHIADLKRGMLGANAVVGAGVPLATGAALTAKLRKADDVAVSFAGDGAINQGVFSECLNLAAIWDLPLIFVVENNGWAQSTSFDFHTAVPDVAVRAAGFGVDAVVVDGHDYVAVHEAAGRAIRRAREGLGPTLLECRTTRYYGHYEGDQQQYRDRDEVPGRRRSTDCLDLQRDRMLAAGTHTVDQLDVIDAEARELAEQAVSFAESSPYPGPGELTTNVYLEY